MQRRELRRRLLVPGIHHFQPETVQWDLEQSGLLNTQDGKSFFDICLRHTALPEEVYGSPVRPRDGVLAQTGIDVDEIVHPWLIRLCAVFTDQGLSYWRMPNREVGLLGAAVTLLQQPACFLPAELACLARRCKELRSSKEEK